MLVGPRVKPSRVSLPITALRLTPIRAAISRQERPASKCCLRSSTRSVVQVGMFANMLRFQILGNAALPVFPVSESLNVRRILLSGTRPSGRPAIVADRQQPVLDGEPNAFLDQGLRNAGNAGAVSALFHQLFEIADGRERQGYGNAVGFGFFCSHAGTLTSNHCTEKYLFRLY